MLQSQKVTLLILDNQFSTLLDCDSYYETINVGNDIVQSIQSGNKYFDKNENISNDNLLQCLTVFDIIYPDVAHKNLLKRTSMIIDQSRPLNIIDFKRLPRPGSDTLKLHMKILHA